MLDTTQETISAIAARLLTEHGGDVEAATKAMVTFVHRNRHLYVRLMDPLVRGACYDAIRAACRHNRSVIWNMPQPSGEEERANIGALAEGTTTSLMYFALPGGMYLKDARRDDLDKAVTFYHTQSKDMSFKERWLALVRGRLTDKRKVSQVLTPIDLIKLKERAEHAKAK
jgi:hypothetical protein